MTLLKSDGRYVLASRTSHLDELANFGRPKFTFIGANKPDVILILYRNSSNSSSSLRVNSSLRPCQSRCNLGRYNTIGVMRSAFSEVS
jgi:hypothetical protein